MSVNRFFLALALLGVAVFSAPQVNALEVGNAAPDFTLSTYDGKQVSTEQFRGKTIVLEWFNPGCPFVMKHYRSKQMQQLQDEYVKKGVVWLTINSTNPGHRDFLTKEKFEQFKQTVGVGAGTYLQDPQGEVGKKFGAKSTPHMFIIDKNGLLAYQGAIDDAPSFDPEDKVSKHYVRMALDELLAGKVVTTKETEPYGCSVKYPS